jgi:hypothetical protein
MRHFGLLVSLALASLLIACTSDAPIAMDPDGSAGDGGGGSDAGGMDASDLDSGALDAGGADAPDVDGSSTCTDPGVGRLCVRGEFVGSDEVLTTDTPVRIQIFPHGCHSSACTVVDEASCTATLSGSTLAVDGGFCLHREGECSLPDCSGGGFADCDSGVALAAGDYTATYGGLSVSFTVPSTLPPGSACAEVGEVGATCDPGASACAPGLACCYPCGIPGCDYSCTPACEEGTPGCAGGCIPVP